MALPMINPALVHQFVLPYYISRKRRPEPDTGLPCPQELHDLAKQNGLTITETVTDGNCGLHAFAIVLRHAATETADLASSAAVQKFMRQSSVDAICNHLRHVAATWMRANKDSEVWEGLSFGQLALAMCRDDRLSYSDYIRKVSLNHTWLDSAGLHALACAYNVDICVFQPSVDPALLGPSLYRSEEPSKAMVCLGMVNDLHFWALLPCVHPLQDGTLAAPDRGAFTSSSAGAA